jgi:DNA mismatch endonuclease, patch repair protein
VSYLSKYKTTSKLYIRDGRAPIPEKEVTSRIMSAIKAKNTKPELMLRKALWESGLKGYRLHCKEVPGKPDIFYPGKKIAIFVNGCYWHRCPHCKPSMPKTHIRFWSNKFSNNLERDKRKQKELIDLGWKVLIFWECQLNKNMKNLIIRVKRVNTAR